MSSVSSNEEKRNATGENVEDDDDFDDEERKKLVTDVLDKFSTSSLPPAPPNGATYYVSATTPTDSTVAVPSDDSHGKTANESAPGPTTAASEEVEQEETGEPTDGAKMTMSDDTDSNKKLHQEVPLSPAVANSSASTMSEEAARENDTSRPHVLPADFEPTPAHVLCGRRKGHKDFGSNWPGNLALEQFIAEQLDEYESASNSEEQAKLVTRILAQVRAGGGGFVRISMLQDDDKKSQQRWMDIGDNARKDIDAIFKLFLQARQNQTAQQKNTATAQRSQPKRASPQKGLLESPQGNPQVQDIQLAARLQVMGHTQNGREDFQIPSKVPTKLYAIEEKNAKRTMASSGQDESKRSTAMLEHFLDSASLSRGSRTGNSPYDIAAVTTGQTQQFQTGLGQRPVIPSAGAMRAPATTQPLVDRPRKRRSVDENAAVDALQLIAQVATQSGDDFTTDLTTNSSPTVRRRPSTQAQRTRPATQGADTEPRSHVRVCCLQLGERSANESPWDSAQRALACLTSVAINERDVDLFVFPEMAPFGSSQDTFTKYLPLSQEWQRLYQRIDEAFATQAKELGVFIVYGMIGWYRRETDRSLKFTLQHKVVDRRGNLVAVYDKSYLSDVEFRFFEAGPRKTTTFEIDGFRFGLLVGDDLKYPNMPRSLARDCDVDVIIHPSASPVPRYFRQCRATENAVYVLGVEYSNGITVAVPPDPDHAPVALESPQDEEGDEGYLLTKIQRAAMQYARSNFPYYRHMKTEPTTVL